MSSGTFTYDYLTRRRNCKYKFIRDAFAEYLYNNLGWEVAKSKGSGGSQGSGGTRITVAVKGGVYPLKGSHNIE